MRFLKQVCWKIHPFVYNMNKNNCQLQCNVKKKLREKIFGIEINFVNKS